MRGLNLPRYDRPVRYVCSKCGGWWTGDANRLIVGGITGHEPDDPVSEQIDSAREREMSTIARHRNRCDGSIRIIYPNSAEWQKVDDAKRED